MATRQVTFANEWMDSRSDTASMDPTLQTVPDFEKSYFQIKGHNRECDNPTTIFTVGNTTDWYSLSRLQKQTLHSALPTALREDGTAPESCFKHGLSIRAALKWFFTQNSTTRLHCMLFDFVLKCIICLLYVIRVVLDDISQYECGGSRCTQGEYGSYSETGSSINWYVLLWVQRPWILWMSEAVLSFISLTKFILKVYAASKGHRMDLICTSGFFIEAICSVPLLASDIAVNISIFRLIVDFLARLRSVVCHFFLSGRLTYPMIYPNKLKDVFVPVFLNCWLAKQALQKIYNDLHLTRQRFQTISVTLLQQMCLLLVNIVCLVFINICFMQHLQRASPGNKLTMFQSTYFVIVTFSTVGYGDISPDIWLSRLFTILMICLAFASIPRQVEAIVSIYMERRRAGGEYSRWDAHRHKHVVVCSSTMTQSSLMDFLNEFYAHSKLEQHTVILLCPRELEGSKQAILKDPKWTHRVIYMKGSPLKDLDLQRCRLQQAKACFFLAPRPAQDKVKADYHTILRSWAVKDFAPNCKQYIHLFCAANRIHVNFAEHIVCEEEFKYSLLANNCLYPGLSTLVSLLVHTSTGQKVAVGPESWQQIYGHHSRNEIYHVQLQKSVFFRQYEGETFPAASADAHRRFGVSLLAVLDSEAETPHLQLNPGPEYRLKAEDFCFYMSIMSEEYAKICPEVQNNLSQHNNNNLDLAKEKGHIEISLTIPQEDVDESVSDTITSHMENNTKHVNHSFTNIINSCESKVIVDNKNEEATENKQCTNSGLVYQSCPDSLFQSPVDKDDAVQGDDEWIDSSRNVTEDDCTAGDQEEPVHRCEADHTFPVNNNVGQEKLTTDVSAVTLGSVSRRTNCCKMSRPGHRCCLVWGINCDRCKYMNTVDERLKQQLIILVAQHASTGIFNFIVPLRSSYIGMNQLRPIVLLLEEQPDSVFLDTVAQFPLVYYMIGSIRNVDDLLLAGINNASHLVVVNRDSDSDYGGEEVLADSETIMAVQTIFKLFPNTNVITELNQATNMRFMQIPAQEASKLGKKCQDAMTSSLNHIFRQPFAAGQVFSANMLDTLLYQTFVKGYLISFVRQLLGIDAEEGSGHLSSIFVQQATVDEFSEYGNLYTSLCKTTGEIPFAIYRTEKATNLKTVYDKRKTLIGENLLDISQFIDRDSAHKPRTPQPGNTQTQTKSNPVISQHCFSIISKENQGNLGCPIDTRQKSVELSQVEFSSVRKQANTISYVITNPSPKQKLKSGDIVYTIQSCYSGQTFYCPSTPSTDYPITSAAIIPTPSV